MRTAVAASFAAFRFAAFLFPMTALAQQVGSADIGGVVSGPKGPEAGVWVIAETRDLPTKYAKVVVTDDKGRYLIPDLPAAKYGVAVPVKDAVFITLDRGVDNTSRVFLGDGLDEATEIKSRNLPAQESQIVSYVERELATTTPRKHQVVIKAAKGLKHREVARVLAAVGKVEKVERVHIGVLEGP